jgi:glucokinase
MMIAVIEGMCQGRNPPSPCEIKHKTHYDIIPGMDAVITVDIGGTSMRAATYPSSGNQPLSHQKITTHSPDGTVFDRLVGLIQSIWPKEGNVRAISVGSAGPLDPTTGFIMDAPNIPGWKNFPLGEKLQAIFPPPVFIGNDANLAALGEWKYGSGVGHHDLIYLTISTGIGGGVISKDVLLEGSLGMAAELGHITVLPDGPVCSCGKQGHLEGLSSGTAIVEYVRTMLASGVESTLDPENDLSAYGICMAARNGDHLAIKAFAKAGFFLGQALASFIHIFNPSIIVLGGGVTQSGSLLIDPMMDKLNADIMDPCYLKDLQILPAKLGDDAGLLGALGLARGKLHLD